MTLCVSFFSNLACISSFLRLQLDITVILVNHILQSGLIASTFPEKCVHATLSFEYPSELPSRCINYFKTLSSQNVSRICRQKGVRARLITGVGESLGLCEFEVKMLADI